MAEQVRDCGEAASHAGPPVYSPLIFFFFLQGQVNVEGLGTRLIPPQPQVTVTGRLPPSMHNAPARPVHATATMHACTCNHLPLGLTKAHLHSNSLNHSHDCTYILPRIPLLSMGTTCRHCMQCPAIIKC